MTAPGPAPSPHAGPAPTALRPTWWGLGDAAAGWLASNVIGVLWVAALMGMYGYTDDAQFTLAFIALTYPPLWIGLVGVPVWAAHVKGNGWIADFGVHLKAIDVPVGIAAGLVAQLVFVPLVSFPVLWLTGKTTDDLTEPARELADKAVGGGGAVLFLLIVVVGAPIAEELFYRGLVLRSFEHRFAPVVALLATTAWFAATHLQPLQFVGLFAAGLVFGLLAQRAGRLGPAIVAHMTFNATAAVSLLLL